MASMPTGGTDGPPVSRRLSSSTSNAHAERKGRCNATVRAGVTPEDLRSALGVVDLTSERNAGSGGEDAAKQVAAGCAFDRAPEPGDA
ncbi:MAG: hypothetical protein QOG44_188 [Acidimicrobiaceae bacterium]|nr:hypothetical protein [Acidimicrobiaceae bacterium]